MAASELTILDLATFEVIAANLAISGMKESDLTGSGLTGEDWTRLMDNWNRPRIRCSDRFFTDCS